MPATAWILLRGYPKTHICSSQSSQIHDPWWNLLPQGLLPDCLWILSQFDVHSNTQSSKYLLLQWRKDKIQLYKLRCFLLFLQPVKYSDNIWDWSRMWTRNGATKFSLIFILMQEIYIADKHHKKVILIGNIWNIKIQCTSNIFFYVQVFFLLHSLTLQFIHIWEMFQYLIFFNYLAMIIFFRLIYQCNHWWKVGFQGSYQ